MTWRMEPFRKVVCLSRNPIYFVHADPKRPIFMETLECGHEGNLVEKAPRMPRKRRCWRCLQVMNRQEKPTRRLHVVPPRSPEKGGGGA